MKTTYLNAKCKGILQKLLNHNSYLSLQQLAGEMNISQRSIYYYMCRINEWLLENDIPELRVVRGKGILLDEQMRFQIATCLDDKDTGDSYVYSPTERVRIFICSIIYSNKPVLVDTLADYCKISRNSVFNDLKVVEKQLHEYGLELNYQAKKGYSVVGNEINIRAMFLWNYQKLKTVFTRESLRFIDWEHVEYNNELLQAIEKDLGVEYIPDTRESLAILIPIMEQGRGTLHFENLKLKEIQQKKEYLAIEKYFPHLDFKEKIYLCLHLLGGRLANASDEIFEDVENERIYEITKALVTEFEKTACVQFNEKDELERQLFMHINASMYRYQYGIQSLDLLNEEIMQEYTDLFDITRIVSKYLEDQIGMPISDSEVAYLALHFGSHLPVVAHQNNQIRVLIVCANGVSTGNMLKREILRLFPKAKVVGVQPSDRIVNPQTICDLIVSTVKLTSVVPVVMVHPILTDQDKELLARHLGAEDVMGRIKSEEIMAIVQPYIAGKDYDTIKNRIDAYLQNCQKGNDAELYARKHRKGLLEIVNAERVEIHNEKYIWTKSLWKAAAHLLEVRSIEPSYIEHIIDQLRYYGCYMFIIDGVILAHTKPEYGANELDCEIHFFKEPIPFSAKDKASVIITLSAVDHESHLKLLNDLLTIFQNEKAIDEILTCTTKVGILNKFAEFLNS